MIEATTIGRAPGRSLGRTGPPRSPKRPIDERTIRAVTASLFYGCAGALTILVVFGGAFVALPFQAAAIVLLSTALVIAVLIAHATPEGVWSSIFLFFVVFALFHCGLYLTPAFGGEIAEFLTAGWTGWYTPDLMIRAGYLIELGLLAYGLGVSVSAFGRRRDYAVSTAPNIERDSRRTASIVDVGSVLLLASVGYWYYVCASAMGPLFFLQSYGEFRLSTLDASLGTAYLGIAVGGVFVALDPRRASARIGVGVFAVFVLMALAVGLRSSALIPVVAALAVYARTHRMPRSRYFVAVLVVGLLGVSFVQQVRADGLGETSLGSVSASPVKAIEEMGYSARVVVTSVDWHENSGDPWRGGATYWAPIERGVQGVLGLDRVDANQDFRLMNVEIGSRVGQIGGSIIAEAHHNFGPFGVIVVCLLAGFVLGRSTRSTAAANRLAVGGIVMVLLLMHVRNSFAPVVAWALAAFLLLAAANSLAALHGVRRTR